MPTSPCAYGLATLRLLTRRPHWRALALCTERGVVLGPREPWRIRYAPGDKANALMLPTQPLEAAFLPKHRLPHRALRPASRKNIVTQPLLPNTF